MTERPTAPPAPAPPAPAPPAPQAKRSPRATLPPKVKLHIRSGPQADPDRILIYGTGGIGKSTLAAFLPAPLFFDIEGGTTKMNVSRDDNVDEHGLGQEWTWLALRGKLASLASEIPPGVRTVVIDSITRVEELLKEYVIETRRTEKGNLVDSIDGFGWGKGWQFVYDEIYALLGDLDRVRARGVYTCLIAHTVSSNAPNPSGEDYMRWEPLVYAGDKRGRASIRDLLKNWADQMLFLGYDVWAEDGKGKGSGTRTIYSSELPTHVAKSRTKAVAIPFTLHDPGAIWRELGIA